MTKYVAFLKGVNVGGNNLLNMKETCKNFEKAGLRDVSSYRQSGNILFESNDSEEKARAKVQDVIRKMLKKDIEIILRTEDEMAAILKLDPLKDYPKAAKTYVVFLKDRPKVKLPKTNDRGDVNYLLTGEREVYIEMIPKDGRYGNPNTHLEKLLKTSATVRNWNTTKAIAELLSE